MHQRTRPHGEVTGLVCAALPGATTAVAVFGPSRHVVWASPMALFVIVTIAATLCLRGGRGDRGRSPARTGGGRSARYGTARHVGPGSRARRDRPGVPYGPNQAVTLGVPVAAHRTSPSPVRCVDTASLACLVLGVDRIDHRRSHNPAGAAPDHDRPDRHTSVDRGHGRGPDGDHHEPAQIRGVLATDPLVIAERSAPGAWPSAGRARPRSAAWPGVPIPVFAGLGQRRSPVESGVSGGVVECPTRWRVMTVVGFRAPGSAARQRVASRSWSTRRSSASRTARRRAQSEVSGSGPWSRRHLSVLARSPASSAYAIWSQ